MLELTAEAVMRFAIVKILLAMSVCIAGESAYVASNPEPSAEETLILEYMNRFRADPSADADRIAPGGVTIQGFLGNGVDWDMFKSELKALKPAPPLVFNLSLLDAARKHSHYMILNGLTHDEDPSKSGFVAENFGERMRKAGYDGGGGGENCFRDAMNPWHSHAGFIVDFGPGGTGGMQPGRGHRTNMINAGYREVGCSALPHGSGRFSVTHNFGSRRGTGRLAGGVIYFDRNGNNFYDIGEGIGGVKISVEGASTSTWKSGAYALELKSDQALTISAQYAGQTYSAKIEPGKENIKFDWIVPEEVAAKNARR
jgi:serralysin